MQRKNQLSPWIVRICFFVLLYVLLNVCTVTALYAAPPEPITHNIEQLWHIGGEIRAIVPVSDTLYVGMGPDLVIFDIATPLNPIRLASVTLGGPILDIAVSGHYAYVSAGSYGGFIVDVADRSQPIATNRLSFENVGKLAINGNYLYLTYSELTESESRNGIAILDISTPDAPTVVNPQLQGLDFHPYAIAIKDGYLFVAGGTSFSIRVFYESWGWLQAFRLDDPIAPTPQPAYQGPSGMAELFTGLALGDGFACTTNGRALAIFDISTPSAIQRKHEQMEITTNETSITFYNYTVYLTAALDQFTLLAVNEPPTITQQINLPWPVTALAVQGHYGYAGRKDVGLETWDLTNPQQPQPLQHEGTVGVGTIVASATHVYVTSGFHGAPLLATVKIQDPAAIEITSDITSSTRIGSLEPQLLDQWLLTFEYPQNGEGATAIELVVYDISNPDQPTEAKRLLLGELLAVRLVGQRLYLVTHDAARQIYEMQVWDLADPTNPAQTATTALPLTLGDNVQIAVTDNLFIYTERNTVDQNVPLQQTLTVLDLTDLNNPQPLSTTLVPYDVRRIVIEGSTLYLIYDDQVSSCHGGLRIYHIAEPLALIPVGNYCWPDYVTELAVDNQIAYVNLNAFDSDTEGLRAVDTIIPQAPKLEGYALRFGRDVTMIAHNGRVYVRGDGLFAYQLQLPTISAHLAGEGTLDSTTDRVTYQFPANTFTTPVTVTHTTRFVDPWLAFPTPQLGIGTGFALTATTADNATRVAANSAFSLTVTYADDALAFVDETTIMLYRWTADGWVVEQGSQVDPATNTVTASPTTTGIWMLAATSPGRTYLPLIERE